RGASDWFLQSPTKKSASQVTSDERYPGFQGVFCVRAGSGLEISTGMLSTTQRPGSPQKPMILWQLRRGRDETASAVMFPLRSDATLLWWIKSDLEGARYYTTKI